MIVNEASFDLFAMAICETRKIEKKSQIDVYFNGVCVYNNYGGSLYANTISI